MAGVTIGTAVIVIEADDSDFVKDLESKLGKQGVAAGDKAGKDTGWSFAKGVAANLTSNLVTKAAGSVGNLFSSAFSKGFGRLVAIDDARGKLRGLGHDADSITTIMDSALASVKGTAFGLGDAATLAATAVASGIAPGEELTKRLRLTGDAATIAGVSMNEMGSIFGKVQTGQKAYTAELNQLADRGIPIYQWLQEELGVSAEALRKMVADGKVDSATFFGVIQKNIGGAALAAGETFSGSLQNVGAALGRVGAAFMEPVFERMPSVFAGIIDALDGIAPAAETIGNAVGSAFAGLIDILAAVGGFIGDHPVLFGVLAAAVLGGAAAFTVYTVALKAWWVITVGIPKALAAARVAVIAFNTALRANPIGLIVTAIGALVGAIVWLWQNNETFRRVVTAAWNGVKAAIGAVVDWFTGTVAPFFAGLWQAVSGGDGPNILQRAWGGVVDFFQGVWDGIVAGINWFTGFVAGLFFKFHPYGIIIANWETIVGFFQGLWASVVAIFTRFGEWVAGVWGAFWSGTVGRLIILPFELGYKILVGITLLIVRALQALADWVGSVFAAGWALVRTYLVQPVIDALAALRPVWDGIVAGFNWLRDMVVAAVTWLGARAVALWQGLAANVTAIVTAIVNWVVSRFNWWRDTIAAIVAVIRDWVTDRWRQLSTAVTDIVTRLVTWAVTRWTMFRDNIVALADTIRDWVVERFDRLRAGAIDLFQQMVDGIGRVWDGLKAIAAAPVRFVIETVLNNGLISGWNWVVDKLSLPGSLRVDPIPMPAFIHGGVLPGGGRSSGDDLMVVDRHGRGVATVASGEPVLSRAMYAANRPVVDAILAGRSLPGFFQGGTLPTPGPVRPHRLPYYSARYAADMGLGAGSPVVAWMDGVVASIQRLSTSYGHNIRVNHGDRGQSLYAHLLPGSIAVAVGQAVRAGMRIASVGYTGNVRPPGPAGAHLHFEILGGNAPIGAYADADTGGGMMAAATQWIAERMTAPVRAAIDKIPGESFITDAAKGISNKLLDEAVRAITGKVPAGDTPDGAVPFVPGRAGSVPGLAGVTGNTYAKAANIYAAAAAAGHRVSSVGGYRGDGEHVTRRALDFMVSSKPAGDWISNYVLSNRARLGLQHVIWWQAINSGDSRGWRGMADRGSWTQNHKDHPHVLFNSRDLALMDSGGWLDPGVTAVRNDSGRREPVLSSGQWANVSGILGMLREQQATESQSKRGQGATITVEYKPTIDPHAVNPRREYENFTHDFIADVEALLR